MERADIAQSGPFQVATVSGTSTRAARSTPWTASYPVGTSQRPLVIFEPGYHVTSAAYADWAHHLTSWGYIVIRAEGPSDFFPDHVAVALDLQKVLTDLLVPGALPVSVASTRIAMSGHALGGKLALMASASDARVKTMLVFDPSNANNGSYSVQVPNIVPQPVADIAKPLGILGETLDSGPGLNSCSPAAQNYQTIFQAAISARPAYEWTLGGAGIASFISNPDACGQSCSLCTQPTLSLAQAQTFMLSSSTAFLETHLNDSVGMCGWLTGSLLSPFVTLRMSNPN
ncbi:chlorophyllase/cutinase-like alpha/beta fold protein [Pseudolysobacter antarcticus]|nr:hypothetical protein [Pseudolysobacter antarcticus]